jgi:hypothetical protein
MFNVNKMDVSAFLDTVFRRYLEFVQEAHVSSTAIPSSILAAEWLAISLTPGLDN